MDSTALVSSATLGDLPGLLSLYRELHSGDPEIDVATASAILREMMAMPGLTVLVAELAGLPAVLAATCTLFVLPKLTHGGQTHALIENVVTLASHRQQGLGRAVLKAAQVKAFAAGCYKILLATGSRLDETLRFYERTGFERGGKTAFQVRRT